jgi:hypothetical protein
MDILAACGLLFCRLIVALGFRAVAPSACFGGDASAFGLQGVVLIALVVVGASAVGYRAAGNSSIVMIIVSLSVLAAGSAAVVHYVS